MSQAFTQFVKILGRGRKGARSLTEQEAEQAMWLILTETVAPEQIGAFWMLIRIREETVDETVGFTRATRRFLAERGGIEHKVQLDWPSYAGKRNELPWFLLAALALANDGVKTVMHGHSFRGEERIYVDQVLKAFNWPLCQTRSEVDEQLELRNFAYIALANIDAKLSDMMDLKYVLGLRSPVNTVVRMMNPFGGEHSVHGVFHKGYDDLHLEATGQLGDPSVLVFRGGNGEAEVNPERDVVLGKHQQGVSSWTSWPKAEREHKRLKDNLDLARLAEHWQGVSLDPFGEQAVRQTLASVAGLVFKVESHEACLSLADTIWSKRDKSALSLQETL
ncbi:glycosyl transferase family protein [Marinomonas sp.]|uniref:glycosyl transferase family protein n=1 Tax=Marinomonas sp. TaxID=1904862 RepID=UPI003C70E14E